MFHHATLCAEFFDQGGVLASAGMFLEYGLSLHVGEGIDMSAVDDLYALQIEIQNPVLQTRNVETVWVGSDCDTALFVDDIYRLLDGQTRWNEFIEPVCQNFPVGAGDLLTYDDIDVIELFCIFLSLESTLHGIVIGDTKNIHPVLPGTVDLLFRFGDGFRETENLVVGDT